MKICKNFLLIFSALLFGLTLFTSNKAYATTNSSTDSDIGTYVVVGTSCPYGVKHEGVSSAFVKVKCNSMSDMQYGKLYQCRCGAEILCCSDRAPHMVGGYVGYYTSNFILISGWSGVNYYECGSMAYTTSNNLPSWEFIK